MGCDLFSLATEGVQGLHPYQPGKPIEELERELGITNIVKLASNENPLGPSPKALNAIELAFQELCRYPDGGGFKLKTALCERYNTQIDQVTLGNGSNDLLEIIARVFADKQSEIVFSQYAFAVYPLVTQSIGAKAVEVPAVDWGHDLVAMAEAINDRTKLVFIANPNNPTGTYVSKSDLIRFLDAVPQRVIVVLDEAYCEYIGGSHQDFPDGVSLLTSYPNLIVTRTFSKAWGLASLRVGYALSHPDVADLLNRVRQPFNVDTFALEAATAVLADDEYLELSRKTNLDGMQALTSGFERMGVDYIPSVGNFVTFDTGRDAIAVYQSLLAQGVIVRPVANYGMTQHLRVSIGLPEENARFLKALAEVLGK
ncbi:histidinol-phosphate transaminase [Alkalimarinus sediminis]|uniref:Histidinol-phosphate aminotransferase n=1 Tax=Alkalimarinus sediminis TaxID=1632866 RepID=A0A9E8KRQ6_9ALTE|nr:histidinol-phosphate transaminase [Alkalimarinus sediminis]UZW76670.1 histidinol-phosphate transaminase [Alkalimarinus sediminis]